MNLFNRQFKKMALQIDFICLSGSWPCGAPQNAYKDVIIKAAEYGKKVILDASGAQLENALKAKPFAVHLNMEEAKHLYKTSDCQSILQDLGEKAELVALTAGKEGLYLLYKGIFIRATVPVRKVISSVGSGDCLTAGIAYALHHHMPPEDIARWAVACGAANCLREELGMFYREDVDNLLNEVSIKN
jgi:fructose-1-phosphate kinase PfkB-like protein